MNISPHPLCSPFPRFSLNSLIFPSPQSLVALTFRIANCLQISDDDEYAYVGTSSGDIIQVWQPVACAQPQVSVRTRLLKSVGPEKTKIEQGVTSLAVLRNGELVVGGGAGTISRMRPGTWRAEASTRVEGMVTSLALRGEGQELYAGTDTPLCPEPHTF